jgi:hypothetical protein
VSNSIHVGLRRCGIFPLVVACAGVFSLVTRKHGAGGLDDWSRVWNTILNMI